MGLIKNLRLFRNFKQRNTTTLSTWSQIQNYYLEHKLN